MDLAGSERVAKTKTGGRILQEAKHINLSLHHLEHVIVTLQQFGKHGSNPHTSRKGLRSFNSSQSWRMSQDSVDDRFHVVRTAPSSPKVIRKHVPYRNCMLTMVLKDSLGRSKPLYNPLLDHSTHVQCYMDSIGSAVVCISEIIGFE